jgi:ferritin-like metal-binding protein YciE
MAKGGIGVDTYGNQSQTVEVYFYTQNPEREDKKMDTPITRAEHEEFRRRIEQEDHRQNRRIDMLENNVQQIGDIATSVEKMAVSLQSMVKEQEQQGKRLEALESRDGEMWRKVVGHVVTAVISIVIGFAFAQIGM